MPKRIGTTQEVSGGDRAVAFGAPASRCLDVRPATSSAFKSIEVGQVAKARRYSGKPHDLSAAWAKRWSRRTFVRMFVAHGAGP
jgi:hypothetical protein